MQVPGARDIAVDFHHVEELQHGGWPSVMVGTRIWSTPRAHQELSRLRTFTPIQVPRSLRSKPADCVEEHRMKYQKRRDVMVRGRTKPAGWSRSKPRLPLGEDPEAMRSSARSNLPRRY